MENKDKTIILILVVIIAALIVCLAAVMPNANNHDTKLTFDGNSALTAGSSLKITLTDANGKAISNQSINISLTGKNKARSYYVIKTNAEGVGELKLDKSAGDYNVLATYRGNDNYNGCNATKDITVEGKTSGTRDSSSKSQYDINNLPPSNDPYPETKRYFIDEYHVKQEYSDGYMRTVDIRTGEVHSLGFK